MRGSLAVAVGGLLFFMGLIFTFQGLGYLEGLCDDRCRLLAVRRAGDRRARGALVIVALRRSGPRSPH